MNGLPRLTVEQSAVVAWNMRGLRGRAGWTQRDLAKLLGKSTSGVCRMEKGHYRIEWAQVVLIAGVFQVTAADLLSQCQNCQGSPPTGFACLACGAGETGPRPGAPAPAS